jgi:hypothetical protein
VRHAFGPDARAIDGEAVDRLIERGVRVAAREHFDELRSECFVVHVFM